MIEFAQTQRLLLARRLLTDTRLPVTIVALTCRVRERPEVQRRRFRKEIGERQLVLHGIPRKCGLATHAVPLVR
jgi:transcriptional regulator GlxA family with amidase domain